MDDTLYLRNYSLKTRKAYILYTKQYLIFAKKLTIKRKEKAIKIFLLHLHKEKSAQTANLALNSIKFLYKHILNDPTKIDIKFAKRPKKLPIVLSKNEIEKIIDTTKNHKYRIMISLDL